MSFMCPSLLKSKVTFAKADSAIIKESWKNNQ
jgi:hypothetical protein